MSFKFFNEICNFLYLSGLTHQPTKKWGLRFPTHFRKVGWPDLPGIMAGQAKTGRIDPFGQL